MISSSDVWAVGYQEGPIDNLTLIEHWNGTKWRVVTSADNGTHLNYLGAVSALSSSNVWAAGTYIDGGGRYHNLVEHWNGTSWKLVTVPDASTVEDLLNAMVAVSSNDIWAGGSTRPSGNNMPSTIHWNGKRWKIVSAPLPGGATSGGFYGMDAVSGSSVYAVGASSSIGFVERWDGSSWSQVSAPASIALTSVAALSSGQVWLGGYSAGSPTQSYTAHRC